jgi:membrane fusion protein, heavy metal efflux system
VNKGEALLQISPSADAGGNIQKIKNDYLLAKAEYERVQNLYDRKAVSRKRLDEARSDFESMQAIYNALEEQIEFTEKGLQITAPISGYLEKTSFNLGDQITSGQELFTIINPSRLILKANVPSSGYQEAGNSTDASFIVEGQKNMYDISRLNGRKISVGTSIDRDNRTIPVYFEFSNPGNSIKVGMFSEVYIKTSRPENHLSIPESAVVDEDGLHTAYVQLEGEAFEKRILKTGITDNGYIQILDGLLEGERVVTKGAYQIRLAALSPESAIGHGHVH